MITELNILYPIINTFIEIFKGIFYFLHIFMLLPYIFVEMNMLDSGTKGFLLVFVAVDKILHCFLLFLGK